MVRGVGDGTLTLTGDGSFVYTPDAGFVGVDSFTYNVYDGAATSGVAMPPSGTHVLCRRKGVLQVVDQPGPRHK